MTILEFLILLAVAGVCGMLGQAIAGYSHGGCLTTIALGLIGSLVGYWLSSALHLPELIPIQLGNTRFPIVWSIAGSALFVAIICFLTRSRRGGSRR